jgi:hypothetical protein
MQAKSKAIMAKVCRFFQKKSITAGKSLTFTKKILFNGRK